MTIYQRPEPLCEHEIVLNERLSACKRKGEHCEYLKRYASGSYCRKRLMVRQAEEAFQAEVSKFMNRKVNGGLEQKDGRSA